MTASNRLSELLHQYFELGVVEGREGRNHDTEAGDAQRVLSEIEYEIAVHRLTKATPTDIKTLASQVAYISLSSINAHSSRSVEIATAHVERALVACALSAPEPQPAAEEYRHPEWIWYCESTTGPMVTFGRWAKNPQQKRYKLADIQPTEHDHPAPAVAVKVAEGWQLVPKEPTNEMHNAARDWAVKKYGLGIGHDGSDGCYRAMLAAAPAKQED